MKKSDKPIVVKQKFTATPDVVWRALTDVKQMQQWFFNNIPSFEPVVGFETEFVIENEDRIFTHLWKIVDVVPLKQIVYNWKYAEHKGDSLVYFELEEEADGAYLTVRMEILDDFSDDIPEFTRESGVAGWEYFIQENLKEYLS